MPLEISTLDIAARLGAAMLLGGLVGLERERHGQPAGLRTHMILSLGGALATIASIYFGMGLKPESASDPGRIAAQVVSGIGFLGAGAIVRYGMNIRGLTTASSLWTTAIIGLMCGLGVEFAYIAAGMATAFVLISLTLLDQFERRVIKIEGTQMLEITLEDRRGLMDEVRLVLMDAGLKVRWTGFEKMVEENQVRFDVTVKVPQELSTDSIIGHLSAVEGVVSFKLQ